MPNFKDDPLLPDGYQFDVVEKWDKVKGKAYVIRDSEGKVIAFGKYSKNYTQDYFIRKHENILRMEKKQLDFIYAPDDPREIKKLSYKKKLEDSNKKALSWIAVNKKPEKGEKFNLVFMMKDKKGQTIYGKSTTLKFHNNSDLLIAYEDIRYKINQYDSDYKLIYVKYITWKQSKEMQLGLLRDYSK